MTSQQSTIIIKTLSAQVSAQQAQRKASKSQERIIQIIRQRRSLRAKYFA